MAAKSLRAESVRRNPDPVRFIAALLAPLPAGEEPVDTPEYRKSILQISMREWLHHMDTVRLADAQHTVQALKDRGTEGITRIGIELYQASVHAQLRQCLLPAPTTKEIRWKERVVKMRDPKDADIVAALAAIAADRARLCPENQA